MVGEPRRAAELEEGGAAVDRAPHILLVDDEPVLIGVFAEVLRANLQGAHVDTAHSAVSALEKMALTDYDVVVSDVLMPGIDGLGLLEQVRATYPGTLIVLVTGVDDHDITLRALRGGAYDFLLKPVAREHLLASIRRAIETRRLQRAVELQQATLREHAEALERAVEERTRELREAHRIKDEFLATVSHELRTPLTAILGWARLMRRGRLDEATKAQAVESIERNARSQSQLIDDLLDVSRIITGKLRLDVQIVHPVDVLDTALDALLPAAQAKGIGLDPIVEPDVGAISGDPERLQQVMWNLLSNAIKFTPSGGNVVVRVGRVGQSLEIAVSDSGAGISADFLPFVFDRFRQGGGSVSDSRQGLGLGLAIVRHLVELHGGTVRVESPGPGKGTTFTVKLPTGGPPAASVRERRITLSTPEAPRSQRLRGFRVLVVDDEEDTRHVLRITLEHGGAEVSAAATARDALEAFRRGPPDAILCDIGLADEDGYSLIGKIRALPKDQGGTVPAIALTAFAKPEDRVHALSAGFHLHVPKPGPADLAAIVASLVETHRRAP